jgi:hypothetical protein
VNISRTGPRMIQCLSVLKGNGGAIQGKWNLARTVGPHGSNAFGDRTVSRCVSRGWIALVEVPGKRGYLVTMTDEGYEAYRSLQEAGRAL